jgi:filamentous hemagglutinin family protein
MKTKLILSRVKAFARLLVPSSLVLAATKGYANPQGLNVVSGSAQSVQQGNTLQVTTSQNAFLQWNSFNIASGETTVFQQPSSTSVVFNRITGGNVSSIFGSLQANGIVVLQNQNGFYFGPNAFVSANGLVLTTAAINPWSSGGGIGWSFTGPPTSAPIVNYGHLETASGGSLFVISKEIDNHGTIQAPGGTAALLGGQEVLLSQRPDGLSLSVPVKLPAGTVNNAGKIMADAGQVLLQAQTVNNSGTIQANSVRQQNGVIELYASQNLQLSGDSSLQAKGDSSGVSPGGTITVKSGNTFSDSATSQISTAGGSQGGNGGNVEVSAPNVLSLNSKIDASAQNGWNGGLFTLDPENITLGSSGTTSGGTSGTVNGTGSSGSLSINVNTAFQNVNSGSILLEASGTITLNSTWNVSQSAGGRKSGQLTLEAGGNITLNNNIIDPNNWSITLKSGYTFGSNPQIAPGVGTIKLAGSASIETATGSIDVEAGSAVTLGSGSIVSGIANGAVINGNGGNVNVQAVSGTVTCVSGTSGYNFTTSGYTVSPTLSGISTASGGNVRIKAGGNIVAGLPSGTSAVPSDFGTGAFGPEPGNVTLIAGGNVTGHFVVADGTGTITAGNAGTATTPLALSLVAGSWDVTASANIVLQEVRNPNGIFNSAGTSSRGGANTAVLPYQFLYNYDPLASVSLDAGNGITITGNNVPRVSGNLSSRLVFPPLLTMDAGAGGITLKTPVNLFPSPDGTLNLTTTGGGSVTGQNGGGINISDSSSAQGQNPNTFTPNDPLPNYALHLNDPNPVQIRVSGSVSTFAVESPKPVEMSVAGDLIDSGATIQNLHTTDTSTISVGGQILDHSDYVILTLPPGEKPNFAALDQVAELNILGPNGVLLNNPNLNPILLNQQAAFTYDAKSGTLKYSGAMTLAVEQALLAMKTPFLDPLTIETIYTQSQLEPPVPDPGYIIAGPGAFHVSAASVDLGNGGGIVSQGIENHIGLLPYTAHGAEIDLAVAGDLSMLSSTIESEYGGDINVRAGGTIDIGSAVVPSTSKQYPLGIVSLWQGNINVIAQDNINLDGSRIAAYDGGNVFVESLTGNVNAGAGGSGEVQVTKPNPHGPDLIEQIPGSGILATSFPQLLPGEKGGKVGDITVETPEGNIQASKGGIVQIALGPNSATSATINLQAGSRNSDGTVAYVGSVDASGSGVIGGHVNINATGNINGLVVASAGATISALQNVSATVLSQGNATVTAGGTVSGTVVGVGSVSVSGAADVAAAFAGGGVTTSGAVSGAAVAAAPTGSSSTSAAATTQQVNQSTTVGSEVASSNGEDDPLKKKKRARLMEYVGRVRVLLPK